MGARLNIQPGKMSKMKLKNFTVIHKASGAVRHHAGESASSLLCGESSAERSEAANVAISAERWNPSEDWDVIQVDSE